VRDSLSIADSVLAYSENNITIEKTMQVLGINDSKSVIEILSAIASNDVANLIVSIKKSLSNGKNISLLCKELTECFKNLLLIKQGIEDVNILSIMSSDLDALKDLSTKFSSLELKTGFEKLSRIELDLKFSLNPENLLTSACVSVMSVETGDKVINKSINQTEIKPEIKVAPQMSATEINVSENKQVDNTNKLEQPSNNQIIDENASNNVPIGRIWGEVLLKIKSKNMFAFSASLQNINKVDKSNKTIILYTNDKNSFDTVDEPDKKSVILDILKELGYNFNSVMVEYDQTNKSQADIIKSLKNTFLDKIKIK